jgi:hypothetical protein
MKRHWIALTVALALAGCNPPETGDANICVRPPPEESQTADISGELRAKGCVHRWAYRLSSSRDAANLVAEAAVYACEGTLPGMRLERLKRVPEMARAMSGRLGKDEAWATAMEQRSISSGKEIGLEAKAYEDLRAEALFRVVQARAGKCSPDVWIVD